MIDLPFISVIIPTYNREKYLAITLDSFISQSYPKDRYEIIVSNNHSTDSTQKIIEDYCTRFDNIKTIFEGRQGVHYARNSAAKIAKGDILYFTDDDMIADSRLIEEIVRVIIFEPQIGAATGVIIGKFAVEPPAWVSKYLTNGWLSLTDKNRREKLIISKDDFGVYSCHEAIKREVFFEAGGFNPENTAGVWVGDGETGLSIKIKQLGYTFAYTSKSIIYHMIPESRMTLRYLINRAGNQGFCRSYTEYRMHRNKKIIIPNMIRRNIIGIIKLLIYTSGMVLLGKQTWRFLPAQLMYLHRRNIYDIKLYRNKEFRKVVEIDNWINN